MMPHVDTYATATMLDRQLTLRRAERRALLLATATRPPANPGRATVGTPARRRERLAGVVRSLRALLRPAHA